MNKLLPGMFDIVPASSKEGWQDVARWQTLEKKIREQCGAYGYEEIRTPVLEKASLFLRSSGDSSDIVSKELYQFTDKGAREIALRPEGTACVLRSYIEQPQEWQRRHSKLFYIAPMFRYDRPQAGRYRQHHQFGVESIGVRHPMVDVEVMDLLYTFLKQLGINDVTLSLNSLGSKTSREQFIQALKAYYIPRKSELSEDSQRRLETNPLRILDSKDPQDRSMNAEAPSILDFLSDTSCAYFEAVKRGLDRLQIPYHVDPHLVRGLDYYQETVFECTTSCLGAQNSLGGGGRYDGLLDQLGGEDLPSCGFGMGLERVLQTLTHHSTSCTLDLYMIPLGAQAIETATLLAKRLREVDIHTEVDYSGRKLGKMMHTADQKRAKRVAVLGDDELQNKEVKLKVMESGEQKTLPFEELATFLQLEKKIPTFAREWGALVGATDGQRVQEAILKELDQQVVLTKKSLLSIHEQLQALKETIE